MEERKTGRSIKLYPAAIKRAIRIRFLRLEISLLFFAVVAGMFFSGYINEFIIVFISMVMHETGHIIPALLSGKQLYKIRVLPVGLNAVFREGMCTCRMELFIYFCGPLVNVVLFISGLIADAFVLNSPNMVYFFVIINIYLAIFNMLPLLPLDGGRILMYFLEKKLGLFLASKYMRKISIILSILLIVFGIVQLLGEAHNYSLFIIGFYIIFNIKSEKMEAALMNMKQFVYRRTRMLKKGIYPARDLVVFKRIRLSETLKHMDFDRFHLIHLLDDDMKLIKVITEQQIIQYMMKYHTDITFEEVLLRDDEIITPDP